MTVMRGVDKKAEARVSPPLPVRTWRAILLLAVLAPVLAESVASANTPTAVLLLNPLVLVLLAMLYGASALLLREAWVRRRMGLAGVLVAGCAFTVLNEGVVADVLFRRDPLEFPVAALARQWGVNWALAVDLAWFHTIFGLIVPIALTELTFPALAGRVWLRRRGITACCAVLLVVGVASIVPKEGVPVPDMGARASALALALALCAIALVMPRSPAGSTNQRVPSPSGLVWRGALLSFLFGFSFFALPRVAPVLTLPAGVVLVVLTVALVRGWTGSPGWTGRHTVHLVTGSLVPSALASLPKIAILQPLSTLAFAAYLAWLARRVRPATNYSTAAPR